MQFWFHFERNNFNSTIRNSGVRMHLGSDTSTMGLWHWPRPCCGRHNPSICHRCALTSSDQFKCKLKPNAESKMRQTKWPAERMDHIHSNNAHSRANQRQRHPISSEKIYIKCMRARDNNHISSVVRCRRFQLYFRQLFLLPIHIEREWVTFAHPVKTKWASWSKRESEK